MSKVDLKAWLEDVCKATSGKIIAQPAAAISPKGGNIATAIVKSDPSGGKFAIKDKDIAMAAAFAHLRAHGAFPEDDGDDSDDMVRAATRLNDSLLGRRLPLRTPCSWAYRYSVTTTTSTTMIDSVRYFSSRYTATECCSHADVSRRGACRTGLCAARGDPGRSAHGAPYHRDNTRSCTPRSDAR